MKKNLKHFFLFTSHEHWHLMLEPQIPKITLMSVTSLTEFWRTSVHPAPWIILLQHHKVSGWVRLSVRPKHRAWVHGGQMAHHHVSLFTNLDQSCPSMLLPCPQEIKARWTLSEWSPALAHSSWAKWWQEQCPPGAWKTHTHTQVQIPICWCSQRGKRLTAVLSALWQRCLPTPLPYLLIYLQQWLRWHGHSLSESLPGSTTSLQAVV